VRYGHVHRRRSAGGGQRRGSGSAAGLVGLDGVYRTLPGAGLDPVIMHQVAAATIRSLLGRSTGAITDPAAARSGDAGRAALWPGTLALASP
jgi:hypothetical protein